MTTQPNALDPDVLATLLAQLEETDAGRQLLFQSLLPGNVSQTQRLQYQSLFSPTFTGFLTALGQRIRQGQEPDLTFSDYLQEEFDPNRALLRLPGEQTSALSGGRTVYNFT